MRWCRPTRWPPLTRRSSSGSTWSSSTSAGGAASCCSPTPCSTPAGRGAHRLDEALGHLSGSRFRDVELNVDVKHSGFESALLDELRHRRLLERTLLSSQVPAVLDRLRELEPRVRTGISIGGRISRLSGAGRTGGRTCWRDWPRAAGTR